MVGENGGAVYKDVVFAAFAALEREGVLMLHVVFFTERATVVKDGKTAGI
jgi:hypothetical protein